jgi:uncharacterized protein YdeI (YjbR/CyaY-like superfamily)
VARTHVRPALVAVGPSPAQWVEVRVADFYAPELHDAGGEQAKATLWRLAYGRQATCVADHQSYDRMVAVCEIELEAALDAEPAARQLFDALDAANRFAVLYRVHQAKTPEKRAAKIAEMVAMLSRGETIHPRRSRRSSARDGAS